ncbi:L,D-transpeptidase family protein [Caminicella sporogenes]|uniref:L,D-transpeptidase family protein n=1 Tax=Caminicella sporogenes TaxID=166485 RepID=UPI002540E518|nr:L,D-transpeptidase family protein [Caminicella sporogenes]WIF95525.1 L,D-transpeptidase family protein [Caminicella sporogenes]
MKRICIWKVIFFVFLFILIISVNVLFNKYGIVRSSISRIWLDKEYSLWEEKNMRQNRDYKNLAIFIDINAKTLEVINLDDNNVIKKYIIASGKPSTPSPIGNFIIINKRKWGGGFGTRWMGLNVPWGKYGIHGTNRPESIGFAASHGCIRMKNKDIEELYKIIKVGTPVTIWGGIFGPFGNGFRILKPGDRGSDVYEVQKRMKLQGYYPLWVDGIYGEGMKKYVIKFRKDKKLRLTHNIDYSFYRALGIKLME